jgi:hypothetical protein
MTAAMTRVLLGNSSIGASQMPLITNAWRKPEKPVMPVSWISSWVMPEKYQKNTNSQARPAQSKPVGVVSLRCCHHQLDLHRSIDIEFTATAETLQMSPTKNM